jgi:hypothetical protein
VVTGEDIWVDALLFPIEWSIVYTWLFNNAKGSVLIVMLFHAIDSRPVWWIRTEAGEWSPASSVDRDCASGLVSSLVISVVVKLTFSLRRHGVDLIRLEHRVNDVQVAAVEAPLVQPTPGHTRGTRLGLACAQLLACPNQTNIKSLQQAGPSLRGKALAPRGVSTGWDDVCVAFRYLVARAWGRAGRLRELHWRWVPWWTSGQRIGWLAGSRSWASLVCR